MEIPKIDETKLPEVMEIIEKAAILMEEKDCETDKAAKKELDELQKRLRAVTGKKSFNIKEVSSYWGYTDLETIAAKVLMKEPQKLGLSEEALRNLIIYLINSDEFKTESKFDYWYEFLERETGIEDTLDYLFCRTDDGGVKYAPIDTIMSTIKQMQQSAEDEQE